MKIMRLKLFILEIYLLDYPLTLIRNCNFTVWQAIASKSRSWYWALRIVEETYSL
jgi:hypothetical protein